MKVCFQLFLVMNGHKLGLCRLFSHSCCSTFRCQPIKCSSWFRTKHKDGVLWQVLYLCTISVTLYFSSSLSIEEFLIAFVVHEVVLYLIYLFLILKGTKEIAKC